MKKQMAAKLLFDVTSFLVIIKAVSFPVPAEITEAIQRKVDAAAETVRRCYQSPGLSLAVVKDGRPWYTQGYGVTDHKTNNSVTQDTLFCIASNTKSMSATLLAILLEENRNITWTTPLRDIMGADFQLMDGWRTERATLADVLAHRLGTGLGSTDFGWMSDPFPRDELVRRLAHFPIHADFRTEFIYNNFVYGLAAVVAEKLGGKTWEQLMKEKLFDPLGMHNTSFIDQAWSFGINKFARPHCLVNKALFEVPMEVHRGIGPIGSAASVSTSAADMAKYMALHLNQGRDVTGRQVVPRRQIRRLHAPEAALPGDDPMWDGMTRLPAFPVTETRETYAFGWVVGSYRGYKAWMHGGVLFGYDSLMTLYPQKGVGIYVGVNGAMGDAAQVAALVLSQHVADLAMGLQPWLNHTTLCTYPSPWRPRNDYIPPTYPYPVFKGSNHSRPIEEYVGNYTSKALGNANVSVINDDGQEVLFLEHGKIGRFKLYPSLTPDKYQIEGVDYLTFLTKADAHSVMYKDMSVTFKSEKGKVNKLTLNFIESYAPTEFCRHHYPDNWNKLMM